MIAGWYGKRTFRCMLSCFSHFQCFGILWTVAHQDATTLSLEFSRKEYWSGLPCLPPEYLYFCNKLPNSLSKGPCQFVFPQAMNQRACCATSFLALGITSILDFGHSNMHVVVSLWLLRWH